MKANGRFWSALGENLTAIVLQYAMYGEVAGLVRVRNSDNTTGIRVHVHVIMRTYLKTEITRVI